MGERKTAAAVDDDDGVVVAMGTGGTCWPLSWRNSPTSMPMESRPLCMAEDETPGRCSGCRGVGVGGGGGGPAHEHVAGELLVVQGVLVPVAQGVGGAVERGRVGDGRRRRKEADAASEGVDGARSGGYCGVGAYHAGRGGRQAPVVGAGLGALHAVVVVGGRRLWVACQQAGCLCMFEGGSRTGYWRLALAMPVSTAMPAERGVEFECRRTSWGDDDRVKLLSWRRLLAPSAAGASSGEHLRRSCCMRSSFFLRVASMRR